MSLERRLREAAQEIEAQWDARRLPERRGSGRLAPVVGFASVIVLTAALFVWAGSRPVVIDEGPVRLEPPTGSDMPTTSSPTTSPPTTTTVAEGHRRPTVVIAPGWEDLGLLAEARYHATHFDIGPELVVFGGGSDLYTGPDEPGFAPLWSGIAIDHATGAVRDLPPTPLCPNGQPTAVWTGSELVVWGVVRSVPEGCPHAAAYDPATDSWRNLGSSFFRAAVQQTAWTGEELIDVRAGLAHTLDTGRVREVPSVRDSDMFTGGRVFSPPRVHWTGEEFLALGSAGVIRVDPFEGDLTEGPTPPIPDRARGSVWTGDRLLAVNYDLEGATFDPSSAEWQPIGRLPLRFFECRPEPVAGGGLAFVNWCSGIGVWDGSGEWSLLASPALSGSVFGRLVVGGGYLYQVGERVVRHPLPEVVNGVVTHPRFLPVGAYHMELPAGWTVARIYSPTDTDPETGTRETVSVDVRGPGGTCRVSSSYQGIQRYVVAPLQPAMLQMSEGVVPAGVTPEGPDGVAHVVVAHGSDLLDVACPELTAAEFLVLHVESQGGDPDSYPPGVAGDDICDVQLAGRLRPGEPASDLTVQLQLLEGEPCGAGSTLWLRLQPEDGPHVASARLDLTVDLNPGAPYVVFDFEVRNWCGSGRLTASIMFDEHAYAFIPEVSAPCQDADAPPELDLVGGPTGHPDPVLTG